MLIDASKGTKGLRPLGLSDKFDFGLFLCGVGSFKSSDTAYWLYRVNRVEASVGGEQFKIKRRDKVLWYFSDTVANVNTGSELVVNAPARARTGRAFTVSVSAYTATGARSPAAGARVAWNGGSATTDATGRATVTADDGGQLRLRATRGADIPSAVQRTCVARRLSGCSPVRGLRLAGTAGADSLKGSAGPGCHLGRWRPRQDRRPAWPRRLGPLRLGARSGAHEPRRQGRSRLRGRDPRRQEGPRLGMGRPGRRSRPIAAVLVAIGVASGGWAAPATAATKSPTGRAAPGVQERQGAAGQGPRLPPPRCGSAVAAAPWARGTPLAALLRSKPGSVGLRDYGSCSRRRASSSGQLYVRSIRGDRERGRGGWVYKVGRRLGTAGAADTSGPFGRGRLRTGARLTWFYCLLTRGSCQRTLTLKATPLGGGVVAVTVRGYDDEGRGVAGGAEPPWPAPARAR